MAVSCPTLVCTVDLLRAHYNSIALHPDGDKVYIVDHTDFSFAVNNTINLHSLDSGDPVPASPVYTVAELGRRITGIDCDENFLYWMEAEEGPASVLAPDTRLMRAGLDGSDPEVWIVPPSGHDDWEGGIQRDPNSDRFYILDNANEMLSYFNADGDFEVLVADTDGGLVGPTITPDGRIWASGSAFGFTRLKAWNPDGELEIDETVLSESIVPFLIPRLDNSVVYDARFASDGTFARVSSTGEYSTFNCTGYGENASAASISFTYRDFDAVYSSASFPQQMWVWGPDIAPPLRQRQRDDAFNAPRMRSGGPNSPKSKQYSIRQGRSNVYL